MAALASWVTEELVKREKGDALVTDASLMESFLLLYQNYWFNLLLLIGIALSLFPLVNQTQS